MRFLSSAEVGKWLRGRLPHAAKLFIAAPFVTAGGLTPILDQLRRRERFEFTLLTNLDLWAAATGALDVAALKELLRDHRRQVKILHDPLLHAKVFLIDQRVALVGSANLTTSGINGRNVELATEITAPKQIESLLSVVELWRRRPEVSRDSLDALHTRGTELGKQVRRLRAQATTSLPRIMQQGNDVVYCDNLAEFLVWVRAGDNGRRAVAAAVERLRTRSQRKKSDTPLNDLHFIASLGLVRFKGRRRDSVERTDLGRRATLGNRRRLIFELLWPRYPELRRIGRLFVNLNGRSITRDELAELAKELGVENADIPTNWLRSITLVRPHHSAHKGPTKVLLSLDKRKTWLQDALRDYPE